MARKEDVDLELRLQAIEFLLVEIAKVSYAQAGVTPELLSETRKALRQNLLNQQFEGADPATGDFLSAEIADRVDALFARVDTRLRAAYRAAREAGF